MHWIMCKGQKQGYENKWPQTIEAKPIKFIWELNRIILIRIHGLLAGTQVEKVADKKQVQKLLIDRKASPPS